MKKRFVTIFQVVILISISIMLFTFSACKEDFTYKVNYYDYNNSRGIETSSDFSERIDSFADMSTFCSQKNILLNDRNSLYYETTFYKDLRTYDKSYFRSKSLIIVAKVKTEGYWDFEFGNLKISQNTIIINLLNNDKDDEMRDLPSIMTTYVWVIEIDKNLIGDINQVVVKEYNYLGD